MRLTAADLPGAMTAPKRKSRAVLLAIVMAVIATGFALFSSGDERPTILPIVTVLLFVIPALMELYDRNGGVPFDDIGALYFMVLTLYLVFPIATYWARGLTFTPYNDSRLYAAQPSPLQIAAIEWRYVAYIVPCVIVYLFSASRHTSGRTRVLRANPRILFSCVLLLAGLEVFTKAFNIVYHISGETYGDLVQRTAEVYRSLPHFLVQIEAHCDAMVVFAQAATLVFLFRSYKKYRVLIFTWLIVEAVVVVGGLGSRSPLVWLMMMMVILYDRFVKRIRLSVAVAGAVLFITGYMSFGFIRSYAQAETSNATFLTANNEFEALFANAYDLYQRRENGTLPPVPPQVRFADFIAPVPSQLLPFEKLDESTWYTRVLGIEETGAAYGFGVIAESAIGWGWAELVLKGILTAYMLGYLQRWSKSNSTEYWVIVIYLYLEVSCYWLFRTGSFYFVTLLFFNVLPFYVAVRLLSARSNARPNEIVAESALDNVPLYPGGELR